MRAASAALLLLGCLAGLRAEATVPNAERIEAAVADSNVAAGRDTAIKLELSMQIGDRRGVATAELVSHPTGLARLELRGAGNLVERHLLQGGELLVSRGGRLLEQHRTFLPPYFILQADTAHSVRATLESFGVQAETVGLAACGEGDCLVIGDPRQAVSRPEYPPLRGLDEESAPDGTASIELEDDVVADEGRDEGGVEDGEEGREEADGDTRFWPSLWVDIDSYEVRGIDTADGTRIRLGPIVSYGDLHVPGWVTIEEPGREVVRFDVTRASRVTAAASAFTQNWLLRPIETEDAPPSAPAPPAAP